MKKTKKPQKSIPQGVVRLQKILAQAGIDSRRRCEELILDGAVTINGRRIDSLPAFADPQKDDICIHGKRLKKENKVYFLFNKPKNVICTNFDPQGRRKAIDYVDCSERIFCVGRLDADTTGAILLTNDSDLTNRMTHPKYELSKTYQVTVDGKVDGETIERIKKGVWLSEGKTQKTSVKVLRRNNLETTLQIKISESLNREIRRILAKIGFKVRVLKRTHIGTIQLKAIPSGGYRILTPSEVDYLYAATEEKKNSAVKNSGGSSQ